MRRTSRTLWSYFLSAEKEKYNLFRTHWVKKQKMSFSYLQYDSVTFICLFNFMVVHQLKIYHLVNKVLFGFV